MFLKLAAGLVAAAVLVVLAGVSGLTFYLWPTSLGDHALAVDAQMLARLRLLKQEHKFDADPAGLYFGAPDERQRAAAQRSVDGAIDALLVQLPRAPRRATVLQIFKQTLAQVHTPESEERDQTLVYLQRAAVICGVGSSSELLNVWRYGFPLGWWLETPARLPSP